MSSKTDTHIQGAFDGQIFWSKRCASYIGNYDVLFVAARTQNELSCCVV